MEPGPRPPATTAKLIGSLALALWLGPRSSEGQVPEYQLKAEFIDRFTRFIEWPADSSASDASSPFLIGLYGGNPFGTFLEALTSRRTIKGKPIKVEEVTDPSRIDACAILFIAGSARRALPRILARTSSKPILTVGDTEGFAEQGVIINFYSFEDRIGFEVNDAAARKNGLKLGSQLLRVARIVNLEAPQ